MIKIPRIKLQWGTARQQPGNWYLGLLGFYERKSGGRSEGLAISLRGVLLWGLAAAVAAYFAAASYVFWRLEKRTYNFVRYTDLLLIPLRYQQVEELRGQASIAEGMDYIKRGDWRVGVMLLGIGLEKYPRDLRARLELSRFFLAVKLRAKAQETLFGGLDYGYTGRSYLESALSVATSGEDYELVVEFCDRALASHDPARNPPADRLWLLEQRLRALLAAQRSEEALTFAEAQVGVIEDTVLSELRLTALLQVGRREAAVDFAEAWRTRSGSTTQILRLLARTYREAGRPDDMARILDEMVRQTPADARVRAFSIIQLLLADRDKEANRQIDDYIFRLGGTASNFVLLAEPLAEIKRIDELDRVLAAAAERGVTEVRLSAARLQSLVGNRRWAEAKMQVNLVRAALPKNSVGPLAILDLYERMITAASDPAEGAQSTLVDYLAERQFALGAYRQSIEVLRAAGRVGTAHSVVQLAEGVFPGNRYLMKVKGELASEIAAAKVAAESEKVVRVADPAFASAKAFYDEVAKRRATEDRSSALALVNQLRQAAPVWAGSEAEPLGRLELDLHADGDDPVLLQSAARRYVNADRVRLQNALKVASRLFGAGRKTDARIVLDEILRRVPEDQAALALKTKWFPPAPAQPAAPGPAPSPAPAAGSS